MHCVKIVEKENYLPYTLINVKKFFFPFSTENKNDSATKTITQGDWVKATLFSLSQCKLPIQET